MTGRLEGKLVVITGASGLLGQEHSKAVLEEEGHVVLLDIDIAALEKFKNSISPDWSKRTTIFHCDITDEDQVRDIAKQVFDQLGVPQGLVNNAAINPSVEKNTMTFTRLEDLQVEDWDLQLRVGLTGTLLCSRIFGAKMVSQGIKGSIVNIASDHALIAPNQSLYRVDGLSEREQPVKPITYSVVKHGLIGLTRYLATYWAKDGIRTNALCPGGVLNEQPLNFLERFNALVPMGRPAFPHEYRGALVFMLSDESSYMNGANVVIDGGRSVW